MTGQMSFDAAFRARLRDLIVWRRDVRRFRRDPLPQEPSQLGTSNNLAFLVGS